MRITRGDLPICEAEKSAELIASRGATRGWQKSAEGIVGFKFDRTEGQTSRRGEELAFR